MGARFNQGRELPSFPGLQGLFPFPHIVSTSARRREEGSGGSLIELQAEGVEVGTVLCDRRLGCHRRVCRGGFR